MSNLFKNVPLLTSIKMSPRWNGKGLWVAVYEGVVIQAAGCAGVGGPKPRECRKLFYSEGPWHAERRIPAKKGDVRSEEHTSELQSHLNLLCRLLLVKKNQYIIGQTY